MKIFNATKQRKGKLVPKPENQDKGYYFSVTDDEIKQHLQRSPKDILQWIESTNKFVYDVQTDTERKRSKFSKVL